MRILVVEDEKHLNRIISEAVEDEGYSVDSCFNGQEALEFMECAKYDVMILDIMMPKLNGLDLVRRLRRGGDTTPVLFLTARDSVADRVEGLESGGDYYLVKPFDFKELMAVVRVMTRKYTGNRSNVFTVGDLSLDTSSHRVTRAGKSIDLTSIDFFKYYQNNLNFKIIDIRSTNEFEEYHIIDAINIPYNLLMEKHHLFMNKYQTYYIICKNGTKSYHATKYLMRLGYNVVNVIGGIDHWIGSVVTNYA